MSELSGFPESESVRPIVMPDDELWKLVTPPWAGQIELINIKDEIELPADPVGDLMRDLREIRKEKE